MNNKNQTKKRDECVTISQGRNDDVIDDADW